MTLGKGDNLPFNSSCDNGGLRGEGFIFPVPVTWFHYHHLITVYVPQSFVNFLSSSPGSDMKMAFSLF